jgi:ATP-dependent helicase/nuclease subunit A
MSPRRPPPDQEHRDAAVVARGVNVLVDAGAGTGKTTLLVKRLVEMVAPADDRTPEVPLERIAALTFTRKAAGELRLRVRERLLSDLAGDASAIRRDRLARALAAADTALIGTIHGFADRLLRRKPVEARLSPSYEVVEDADALCRETFELLLHAAEAGRLPAQLEGTSCPTDRAEEAQAHLRAALDAEVPAETKEHAWTARPGLDALVAGFILHRDVPPPDARATPFRLPEVRERMAGFRRLAEASAGAGRGSRWMGRTAALLGRLAREGDPVVLYRELGRLVRHAPPPAALQRGRDFPDDPGGWAAWKAWRGEGKEGEAAVAHRDLITQPLRRWMATRLVRTFPAVVAMYEKVKARHRVVDQVDLLLKLRDLLRDRPADRAELQGLLAHVLVDEFQDTDPLQAEILLYLCEAGAKATRWQDVRLEPGKLTLVGDPKQSIYRFRRADIGVYEAVRAIVTGGPHRHVPLTANFRSEPALLRHLNDRNDEILGRPEPARPDFDARSGTVANRRLDPFREAGRSECVVVLPFSAGGNAADADRRLEARVLATWIRRAVESGETVADPATGAGRPARYGDVAVLAHSTWNVGLLTAELDRLGVPWSARGGTLLLADPLHRQFLLGLRAVADRDDGVALAALLREPFFAVDLADLVRARAAPAGAADEGIERARAADALVRELRRRRHERPPGDTARDLLERTGLARAAAFGPNGLQRLVRLRELCFELERLAAAEGLDYDGVTARLRGWALEPVPLDPPRPVGGDAVQILTIHQAKGLEFPVVAWWDARASLAPRALDAHWFVDRAGASWAMRLDGLHWQEPEASDFLEREMAYHAAERLRLVYVAGTRARDLLVLPVTRHRGGVTSALAGSEASAAKVVLDAWDGNAVPGWARGVTAPPGRRPRVARALADQVGRRWAEAAAEAGRPRFAPRGISTEAHRAVEGEVEGEAGARWKDRDGRHGRRFGDVVHAAMGIALREPGLPAAAAVSRAARGEGLGANAAEAAGDVARALAALEREGLRRVPGPELRLEYPVAAARDGLLLSGYVDLVAAREGVLLVVDFKTDAPPTGDVRASHPDYVEQVRSYGRVLVELGLAREGAVRCGLLFTADGGLRWV